MPKKYFTSGLTVKAMRDNGYKDAAHAIAEIIDNSIQAGLKTGEIVNVELICRESENVVEQRTSKKIEEIAVYDNGCGMDAATLEMSLAFAQGTNLETQDGMGKFGMGLPNSSVSQCRRVDVWSWQKGVIHKSHLDIDEIMEGKEEVPAPERVDELPAEWRQRIKSTIEDSGTLVVWSNLDRLKWKRSRAFFSNTASIVGRMYRYFLDDGKCTIRLASCFKSGAKETCSDEFCKPNDPLYLMTGSQAPEKIEVGDRTFDYTEKSQFVKFGERDVQVSWRGKTHTVRIKASEARDDFRREITETGGSPGSTALGKHAAKNQGVSVVRAGRELELNNSFEITYKPEERWWGIEVSFEPALDEVFGVTNNKQSATAFSDIKLSEIAEDENVDVTQLELDMKNDDDPRRHVIKVAKQVTDLISAIRKSLASQTEGIKAARKFKKKDNAASAASSTTSNDGGVGESDKKAEKLTPAQKEKELSKELDLDNEDMDEEDKKVILKEWLEAEKVIFASAPMRASNALFDVSQPGGKLKITINKSHPAYKSFIGELEENNGTGFDILKLIFASWARLEDTLGDSDEEKERYENLRMKWGGGVSDMIKAYQGNK